MFIFWQKWGANPLPFFSKSAFFQNFMKLSTIPYFGWIEVTDIFLRWKEVFLKMFIFWQKWGANPLPFFSKRAFFQHFMKSSTIPYFGWIEVTDIFLRWKEVFLKMFIFWQKWGANPLPFFSKSAFFQNFMKSSTIPYFGSIEVTDIFLRWKEVFLKMFIFWQKWGVNPLPFFSKSAFFQNSMKLSTIPYFGWIEVTDIFLRWKKVFLKMFIFWQKWGANPLPFFLKKGLFSTFHEIIYNTIFWMNRGHRHLLWDEKEVFLKMFIFWQKKPLAFFLKKS